MLRCRKEKIKGCSGQLGQPFLKPKHTIAYLKKDHFAFYHINIIQTLLAIILTGYYAVPIFPFTKKDLLKQAFYLKTNTTRLLKKHLVYAVIN